MKTMKELFEESDRHRREFEEFMKKQQENWRQKLAADQKARENLDAQLAALLERANRK
jgi:L-serine deaminase